MRILVIIFKHIGDTLLASSLIDNLSLIYKDAIIDVALNKETKDALFGNKNISNFYCYDRKVAKELTLFKRVRYEIGYLFGILKNRYDLVLNLTSGDRGSYIALFSMAKIRVGQKKSLLSRIAFNRFIELKNEHTVERYLRYLKALQKSAVSYSVSFFVDEGFRAPLDRFVHVHPVSRWLFKCLDDDLMAFVIDFIKDEFGFDVIISASGEKKEIQKIESIISKTKHKPINLAGKLTLSQVGALNKQSIAFIGVDTAIMHISAANNTPTFAFFGPSGAFNWGPWQNKEKASGYTKKNGIQKMGKHVVFQESWDCIPCGKDGCDGSKISRCLIELNKEKIAQELRDFFKQIKA